MSVGTTYYIDAELGKDTNSGKSPDEALKSLKATEKLSLRPGDKVLLARNSRFEDQSLHVSARGTADAHIEIGAYGAGDMPLIEANGAGLWYQNYQTELDNPNHVWHAYVSSAVLLYDCEYIDFHDIEITNDPGLLHGERYNQADKMSRTGVAVVAQNHGTLHDITLDGLYVHNVMGNVYDKHLNNGGIYCTCLKPDTEETGIARFNGLNITHCKVEKCSRWGIAAGYSYTHSHFTGLYLDDREVKKYGHENVYISDCYVKDIGGDGITPMYCYRPLVERNVAENNAVEINDQVYTEAGPRQGKTAAAIWPWKCKDALFQYNEAYHTCLNQDGQAWDADSGDGTVYQFNYSHNNGGGCIMFCLGESVNNTFRYNISFLDGDGVINPAENPDAHIYGNTFIMAPGVPFIRNNMSGGHMLVENNIILNTDDHPKQEDWHHQTEYAVYNNNTYVNYLNYPEEDSKAIKLTKNEELLYDAMSGPRNTNGIVHPRSAFKGYIPVKDVGQAVEELKEQQEFFGKPALLNQIGACRK